MFNWLKKLQLEPPKLEREDVEKKRKPLVIAGNDEYIPKGSFKKFFESLAEPSKVGYQTLSDFGFITKVPKPEVPMLLVPAYDYELLITIRMSNAKCDRVILPSPDEREFIDGTLSDKTHYYNAAILYKYYGFTKEEIFQLTGCVIDKNQKLDI